MFIIYVSSVSDISEPNVVTRPYRSRSASPIPDKRRRAAASTLLMSLSAQSPLDIIRSHLGLVELCPPELGTDFFRIGPSTHSLAGWGLFAAKDLPRDTIIPIHGQVHLAECKVFYKCRVEQTVLVPSSSGSVPAIKFAMCRSGYGYYVNHYLEIATRPNVG